MIRTISAAICKWRKVGLILALLAGVVFLGSLVTAPFPAVYATDLALLPLEGHQRILILAPHCDDETLGSAGLILAARRAGIQVRVVIATNGDGYLFATMQDFRKIYPHPSDFIKMGEVRQKESLAALSLLGVSQKDVNFLGYPDRGTPALWNLHWSASNPYRSAYSRANKSPYPITYNPNSVYAGEDYLADVISLLDAYRPDLVIYPHPEDVHPDHWGLNVFTRLALAEISHRDPGYHPKQITYLVHRPDYPVVRGLKPGEDLVPPSPLYAIYKDWSIWDLTPADVNLKGEAVQQYQSQLPLLRNLMDSFVRRNELFASVSSVGLPTVASGNPLDPSTWQDADGQAIPALQLDPTHDVFTHDAVPATDLMAVYAARNSADVLWICSQMHGKTSEEIPYSLRLKSLTGSGILSFIAHTDHKSNETAAIRSGAYVCTQVSLMDLGNPWAIFLGAEAESPDSIIPFDRSAWQMIYVKP